MAENGSGVGSGLFPGWPARTWRAATFVALGLLVLTNLAWLQGSRGASEPGHPGLSPGAAMPAPERVIYEYGKPAEVIAAPAPLVKASTTELRPGERCAGGQIIRRLPNGWEGMGRPCTP